MSTTITNELIDSIQLGDSEASAQLLEILYAELHRMASSKMAHENPGHTLQATALVHEAYLRLLGNDTSKWKNRSQFLAHASEAMRRILIDNARRKSRIKRGGNWARVDLNESEVPVQQRTDELLALDEAISKLEALDARKAQLVKLRFFAGFTNGEAADALEVSIATVERDWAFCRAWLHREMS